MSFVSNVETLKEIYQLFSDIKNTQIRRAFLFKINFEIEKLISMLDKTYYEATVMNNDKLLTKMNNERHFVIMNTHNTLYHFMPYIIAFNLIHC